MRTTQNLGFNIDGSSIIPSALMQITTDNEHSISQERDQQIQNEQYENILAQKM